MWCEARRSRMRRRAESGRVQSTALDARKAARMADLAFARPAVRRAGLRDERKASPFGPAIFSLIEPETIKQTK